MIKQCAHSVMEKIKHCICLLFPVGINVVWPTTHTFCCLYFISQKNSKRFLDTDYCGHVVGHKDELTAKLFDAITRNRQKTLSIAAANTNIKPMAMVPKLCSLV